MKIEGSFTKFSPGDTIRLASYSSRVCYFSPEWRQSKYLTIKPETICIILSKSFHDKEGTCYTMLLTNNAVAFYVENCPPSTAWEKV